MLKHIIVLRPIGPMFQELPNTAFIYTFKPTLNLTRVKQQPL